MKSLQKVIKNKSRSAYSFLSEAKRVMEEVEVDNIRFNDW